MVDGMHIICGMPCNIMHNNVMSATNQDGETVYPWRWSALQERWEYVRGISAGALRTAMQRGAIRWNDASWNW